MSRVSVGWVGSSEPRIDFRKTERRRERSE